VIDSALMRPGRIDRRIYIPPPDLNARKQIFAIHTKKMSGPTGLDLNYLAVVSEGYTGAEIAQVCNEAAFNALRRDLNSTYVSVKDFELAFKTVRPRLTQQQINFYKNFYSHTLSNDDGFKF